MHWEVIFYLVLLSSSCYARIHRLVIEDDPRRYILLSNFGFYQGGTLEVNFYNFTSSSFNETNLFGFTLDRTLSDVINPYLDNHIDECLLESTKAFDEKTAVIYLKMDFKNLLMHSSCNNNNAVFHIYKDLIALKSDFRMKRTPDLDSRLPMRKKRSIGKRQVTSNACATQIPITSQTIDGKTYYSTKFVVGVGSPEEEGLYNLYFHNCYHKGLALVSFTSIINEENLDNYLSAGEMPLPALYFMMAVLFALSGSFWIYILKNSRHPVFKIHYLMAVLVYLKSLSLLFHAINFHFIKIRGEHVEAWAILYYIAHLLKGAVLFITIVLIGTGWTFIKHILSDKDKKIFMIVIPLQVLANIADIIIEESDEGDLEHNTWRDVFIMVDLLCCGAILFPVVWSIRHLQEASQTDGKAAINLRKLKLFRHFYIMIVCYIYFTRIIVYLLKMTVPFQYEWLDEMFKEMATYVFFVLTGYKFRPASANPYFSLASDDEEPDIVLTQSGVTENLSKVSSRAHTKKTVFVEGNDEEKDALIRESSHEYD